MTEIQLQAGFLDTQGAPLYYEVAGNGHPLLLMHAAIKDCRMWLDVPQRPPDQVNPTVRQRIYEMQYHAFTVPIPAEAEEISLEPPANTRLAEIHVPTLLIVGEYDIPDKLELVEQLAHIPN